MFPKLEDIQRDDLRREYVKEELVRMAEAGTLWMTEVMNQRALAYQHIGDVFLGHGLVDDPESSTPAKRHQVGFDIPQELEEYRVLITSIDRGCKKHVKSPDVEKCKECKLDEELTINQGKEPIRYLKGTKMSKTIRAGVKRRKHTQPQFETNIVKPKTDGKPKTEGLFSPTVAWRILKDFGQYVKIAPHEHDRRMNWVYAEEHPDARAKRLDKKEAAA